MRLTEEAAERVYDVLVREAGAPESFRRAFVHAHALDSYGCNEWRIMGRELGFGGKFRSETWTVDYYSEDRTPERDRIEADINGRLRDLASALGAKTGEEGRTPWRRR